MEEKSQEIYETTVYTATNTEIRQRGITQCQKHKWVKLSENEVKCTKCPTALLVRKEDMKNLIKNI